MNPSGRYNQLDLRYRAGDFDLAFEAEWDAPVAALFGPSGSGKSTVLEVIAGVRRGASGRVILDGRTVMDTARGVQTAPTHRWMGWVPQDASLFPHLTVEENVRYGLARGGAEGERRLRTAIAVLELEDLLTRPATRISGGERQRVAVARAVASGARVLLLDEPLAAIDAPLRMRVFPLFLRLRDEIRLPMVYVSHSAEEVEALAGHVLVIAGGRCVASGPAKEVLARVGSTATLDPRAETNRLSVRLRESHPQEGTAAIETPSGLRILMSALPAPDRDTFDVIIREDEIILSTERPGPLSAQNVLEGRVEGMRRMEGHAWITVDVTGTTLTARITKRALDDLHLVQGRSVFMIFKAGSVRTATRVVPDEAVGPRAAPRVSANPGDR